MKQTFDDIVRENTPWIFRYVRGKVSSREIAEDITQEVWLRAFRAYDNYIEDGRLRRWLMRIAQNTVRSYFSEPVIVTCISLDDSSDENDPLYNFLADKDSADPEELHLRREMVSEVLAAIEKLPEKHRMVVTCRFINDMSVSETAKLMKIPEGSVKSISHYAIGKIRKELKINENTTKKGENTMECMDAYKYLFMYALDKIDAEKKAEIKKHLDGCAECRDMVEAMEKLIPHLPKENEDSMLHFQIEFPAAQVSYAGHGFNLYEHESINAMLKEKNGVIGDEENYMGFYFSKNFELLGEFINQGEEIGFRICAKEDDDRRYYVKNTHIPRVYPYMWQYFSFSKKQSIQYGKIANRFRKYVYSAIYQAVPENHGKLRMIRGNGFIDCGKYTFAHAERYVAWNEDICLEYTFE